MIEIDDLLLISFLRFWRGSDKGGRFSENARQLLLSGVCVPELSVPYFTSASNETLRHFLGRHQNQFK